MGNKWSRFINRLILIRTHTSCTEEEHCDVDPVRLGFRSQNALVNFSPGRDHEIFHWALYQVYDCRKADRSLSLIDRYVTELKNPWLNLFQWLNSTRIGCGLVVN